MRVTRRKNFWLASIRLAHLPSQCKVHWHVLASQSPARPALLVECLHGSGKPCLVPNLQASFCSSLNQVHVFTVLIETEYRFNTFICR